MKTYFIIIVAVLLVATGYILYDVVLPQTPADISSESQNVPAESAMPADTNMGDAMPDEMVVADGSAMHDDAMTDDAMMHDDAMAKNWDVVYKDGAFSPKTLDIKKGDTVTWKNEGTVPVWPASAIHPTHTVYPGSDINKCNTGEAATIFDACGGIKSGESWSFQFNEVGSWRYHNHMSSSQTGVVNVSE